MRASDTERDAAINVLNDALTAGRLTLDEHGDRIEAALEATTLEELNDLTVDVQEASLARPQSRRSRWTLAVAFVAAIAIIASVFAIERTPANTSPAAPHSASSGTQTTASNCATSSGSTLMSYTGPENTKVVTPRFTVSSSGCLRYTESTNCVSGRMLLYIYQMGVSPIPEPSLFGCNSLTYRLTAGTYYVVVNASGDWKILRHRVSDSLLSDPTRPGRRCRSEGVPIVDPPAMRV